MREPGRKYWQVWYILVLAFLLLQIWWFAYLSQLFQ